MADNLFDRHLDSGPPADPPASWEESATIEVRRRNEIFGRLRAYQVFLDNRRVVSVGWPGPAVYRVRPGLHTVSAKMDWCRTEVVAMHLRPGDLAVLQCGSAPSYQRSGGRIFRVFAGFVVLSAIGIAFEFLVPGWKGGWSETALCVSFVALFGVILVDGIGMICRIGPRTLGGLIVLDRLDEKPHKLFPDLQETAH